MMRARINTPRFEARVAINVPSVNNVIAHTKMDRVLILCSKNPVIGITTDTVRRNAVVNHCTALAETLRSCMRRGIATAMSVSLSITTKVATSKRLMTSRLRPALSAITGAEAVSADSATALSVSLFNRTPASYHPQDFQIAAPLCGDFSIRDSAGRRNHTRRRPIFQARSDRFE